MTRRIAVTVRGIVQGVGFRPYLHRLAAQQALAGWVRNTAFGVELELEGEPRRLDAFLHTLRTAPPPLAVLEKVESRALPGLAGYRGFAIRPSLPGAHATLVSPDIGTCPDCLRELRTPTDRRYRYPFINCTNCGPRFTITKTVPYDRANTTMAPFRMCGTCAAEYADIENRRYHAQPDCCPTCGPRLQLLDAAGNPLPGNPLAGAQKLLQQGKILAVKGLGGFHLACLAEPGPAHTLRARKHRDEKPFALMCPDVAAARQLCRVSEAAAALLESPRRPILLCPKREPGGLDFLSDTNTLGILLPYTPLHYLLFEPAMPEEKCTPLFSALIMTSANLSDTPVVTENREAMESLAGIADGFLLHDRAIDARCDDSLLAMGPGEQPIFYRRSRGWVPQPIFSDFDADGILALGAEQKAGFALGRGSAVFCPQHIGDLKNAETLAHYTAQVARFEHLFGVLPRRLVCDAHPDYLSTDYARRRAEAEKLPLLQVQHHHAHMASCMADNRLPGDARVIGIVWDGTGLGTDGTIWGGEFFVGGYRRADRVAALRPIALPGGDAAVKTIGRIGFSLARDAGCDLTEVSALPVGEQALLNAMLEKNIHCPESTGMGRLFDGVYALLTGRGTVSYEGQGAVLLQALAERCAKAPPENDPAWALPLYDDPTGQKKQTLLPLRRADTRPLVRALLAGKAAGLPPETLALAFHRALADLAGGVCAALRGADPALTEVVLSGGVFQNTLLLGLVKNRLEGAGFTVYTHHRVAPNDEGIALGQLAVAAHTGA